MRKRSSGVSQIGPERFWWHAREEWQQDNYYWQRMISGEAKTLEEGRESAKLAIGRMEAEDEASRATG